MVNRVLLGRRNDGSYGLDISQAGVEVSTAPDTGLTFSTKSYFGSAASVHQQGYVTRGSSANWPTLPYVPLVIVYINDNGYVVNSASTTQGTAAPGGGIDNSIYREPFVVINQSSIVAVALAGSPYTSCRYICLRMPGGQ